jgi:hypothetical protein
MSLWSRAANELAVRCYTSTTRDITTVTSRLEHEGLSFLAITLADFGKATEKWLDQGFVVPSDVPAFKRNRRTGLPAFLQGFLGRVFDPCSGVLLENPDIEAIYAIRQLTLMFSKIALPEASREGCPRSRGPKQVVSASRERRAMKEFVQCELDIKASDARLDPLFLADFKRMSNMLFSEVFSDMDSKVLWGNLKGKHGPGAVADRLSSNAKWNLRTWTARLQQVMPAESHLIPNSRFTTELERDLVIHEPETEIPVRVISVPKTLKTPRIIAIEPSAMQFAQQALRLAFLDSFSEDSFLSRVIGFDDQVPNQELAREGSLSGDLATLDLSEASDRVSNQHVLTMLEDYPHLLEAVQASRSRKADVPGHGVIRLSKFASMGSALCFPFEAMVFLTVIFLGIERELGTPLSRRTLIKRFSRQVRVFGDDLIVPREHVLSVVHELEVFGHRVNVGKSFWTGRFRESCGEEYYDGIDVGIVKVRQVLPTQRQNASEVVAAVALRNQLYKAGLWKSAAFMDDYLGNLLKVFPNVASTSPLQGRESFLGYEYQGLHPSRHSPLTKGYFVTAKPPRDHLEGSGALLKCLSRHPWEPETVFTEDDLANSKEPYFSVASVDGEHLERSGRPKHVGIKLGKRSPF